MLERQVRDVRDRADETLVVDDLSVLLPLGPHQREHFLVVQLLQPQQLVVVLQFVADAKLVVTVLDVHEHQVHQLPEHFL